LPFIAFGGYYLTIFGALLLQLSLLLDHTDGTLARIKGTSGFFGRYYCGFMHNFIPPGLVLAFGIISYREFNNVIFLIISSITIIAMFIAPYSRRIKDTLAIEYQIKFKKRIISAQDIVLLKAELKKHDNKLFCKTENKFNILTNFIYLVNTFSHLIGIVLICSIFRLTQYLIFFYAPFYIGIAVIKVFIEIRKGMGEFKFK